MRAAPVAWSQPAPTGSPAERIPGEPLGDSDTHGGLTETVLPWLTLAALKYPPAGARVNTIAATCSESQGRRTAYSKPETGEYLTTSPVCGASITVPLPA